MDTDKVIKDLNERFRAPLPEYYKRRIIFWYDEEREFENKLDDFSLENATLVRLTESNSFAVKKRLGRDEPYANFVVYCPVSYEDQEDDWLLDVKLYSEEYRSDLLSRWMEQMHISSTYTMRRVVKNYRDFFDEEKNRVMVASLGGTITTPAQLHLNIMAAVTGAKSATPSAILKAVLINGLDVETNNAYDNLISAGAKDVFWSMAAQATGYSEVDVDFGNLAAQILLTATTRTMDTNELAGLERFISTNRQAWCFDFVSDWLHSDDKRILYDIIRQVERALMLPQRFGQMKITALQETECFPCIDECILTQIMTDIGNEIIDVPNITKTIEKRRTCVWYSNTEVFYEGILQLTYMEGFFKEHAGGFHTVEARNVWKEYTTDYYRMDSYYRQFHLRYAESLTIYRGRLNDLFGKVADKADNIYIHWFLDNLSENWTNACEAELRDHGRILEVPRQTDFYADRIAQTDTNIVVIISDALRYEVATAIVDRLRQDTQSKVELSSMQAILPSITKFGMAALLPHDKLSVTEKPNGGVAILADGVSTESNYRDKVLKAANPKSVALQYKDIVGLSTDSLRALTTGMEVIYIYHDVIDAAGHDDDSGVFTACGTAIKQLQNLVRIVTNKMNRTHILITADHGFLFTRKPLKEDSKVDKTVSDSHDVECGRRYVIAREGAKADYLMPVKFMDGDTGMVAFAPRENMRIKVKGGALNYVHGGASLQEMVVPVIAYQHLRNQSKEYLRHRSKYDTKPVTVALLSAGRKISNMIFSLNFYQTEAVGDNRRAENYLLYFTDEAGNPVSDTQKIIADKTGADNQDRTFRVTFNLKQLRYSSTATYYLVIADEQGLQKPQREEFKIDIAFAVDEFDFFS